MILPLKPLSHRLLLVLLLSFVLITSCSKKEAPATKPKGRGPAPVTSVTAEVRPMRIVEKTIGTLETRNDPRIAAEVAGRLLQVHVANGDPVKKGQILAEINDQDLANQHKADLAEIARLEALLTQQERLLQRQKELVAQNFISINALDDTTAQRNALKSQLDAARARAAISKTNLGKSRIVAPYDGAISQKLVSTGDYVKIGDPLFQLVSNQNLDVRLPFPENVGALIRPGQKVEITSPLTPGKTYQASVEEILPRLTTTSRSVDVIARLNSQSANELALKSGASVDAMVIIGETEKTVMVPEQAIVLRPAGKVVYLIENNQAKQQPVTTGNKEKGLVEITNGLSGGEVLVQDGAGFLTHGAAIQIRNPAEKKTADDEKTDTSSDKPLTPNNAKTTDPS